MKMELFMIPVADTCCCYCGTVEIALSQVCINEEE